MLDAGARTLGWDDDGYPGLLREIPDPPPVLTVRGDLDGLKFGVGVVGARRCTGYGLEQSGRFAETLAGQGLSIVSGGARGVDTAAHRGALRAGGSTVAVLGCGLGHCYPPENAELFETIAASEPGSGRALVSELPVDAPPQAENFPARNRLISGLSIGVLVVEAGHRSGALITARLAAEDQNREVMAIPGRTTDAASLGVNELLRIGGAALVTHPSHVLEVIESQAHHMYQGTHASRFAVAADTEPELAPPPVGLTDSQAALLGLLSEPRTLDQLVELSGEPPHRLMSELTALELARVAARSGATYRRRDR
ncbi:MAG: DNA-processing protein DprA [Planctomycetota bacterium]